jgi:cytoplasmic tRNA 2-thiolation protein 1
MVKGCAECGRQAHMLRHRDRAALCKDCFLARFEEEVHETIASTGMLKRGEVVAIGASGGKDSTALVHIINKLNRERDYGVRLELVSVDEGIAGYRDDSLECVRRNQQLEGLPLTVVSYREEYGWTMDQVVGQIGTSHNCTYCGIFRRRALEVGAGRVKADKILTGHNADDVAETILLNLLRGDHRRLAVCAQPVTGGEEEEDAVPGLPRARPFLLSFQKEIVLYAHYARLDYFSTECVYSKFAFRGHSREFIKEVYELDPGYILRMIRTAARLVCGGQTRKPLKQACSVCSMMSSAAVCKACLLLQGLNRGRAKIKIQKGD